jgi:hypothetical protein
VSTVISVPCASSHKRLFTTDVLSCHRSHHLCGRHLHYPFPVIEIVHPRGRKVHLQHRIMMFTMDTLRLVLVYRTTVLGVYVPSHYVRPFVPRSPIRSVVPCVNIYKTSHKMNQCTVRLRFLPSCACGS